MTTIVVALFVLSLLVSFDVYAQLGVTLALMLLLPLLPFIVLFWLARRFIGARPFLTGCALGMFHSRPRSTRAPASRMFEVRDIHGRLLLVQLAGNATALRLGHNVRIIGIPSPRAFTALGVRVTSLNNSGRGVPVRRPRLWWHTSLVVVIVAIILLGVTS